MKIVFLSNFFNHHQSALSDALWKQTGGEYLFVETAPMSEECRSLGYPVLQRPYVLPFAGNEERVFTAIAQADAVIAGSAPEWLIRKRIRSGKLLFRYLERPLRQGIEPLKYLPRLLRWHWRNPPGKPIYLLCASACTASDFRKFGLFRGKAYRWGYFPEEKRYEIDALMAGKDTTQLLWCGRFLELKHPEDALEALRPLKEEGYAFQLTFLGAGEREGQLLRLTEESNLSDRVHFGGARPTEEVRTAMERVGIYLFTSDRREGWGAVLNEAMNSGCAVIAGDAIGAAPYLIQPGENGCLYPSCNVERLREAIRYLLEHPEEQQRLGRAAWETIRSLWNPATAAERLICLTEAILAGEKSPRLFADGPCSPAEDRKEGAAV